MGQFQAYGEGGFPLQFRKQEGRIPLQFQFRVSVLIEFLVILYHFDITLAISLRASNFTPPLSIAPLGTRNRFGWI